VISHRGAPIQSCLLTGQATGAEKRRSFCLSGDPSTIFRTYGASTDKQKGLGLRRNKTLHTVGRHKLCILCVSVAYVLHYSVSSLTMLMIPSYRIGLICGIHRRDAEGAERSFLFCLPGGADKQKGLGLRRNKMS
jgi:hypothetical protein